MEINIAGGTYSLNNKQFDAQKCVNLYPYPSESGTSKGKMGLKGTPGLQLYNSDVAGAMRGCKVATGNNRCFFVGNNKLYEIDTNGIQTERGTLNTASGQVSMADNGTQLMIVDGTNGYIFTYGSNSFAQIADADFPNGATHVVFLDSYFIVNKADTGKFYISAILDGTSWDALDFATAQSMPDDLVGIVATDSELWLIGNTTIEIFYNSGNADFPFERLDGGVIRSGCAAGLTAKEFDGSIIWLELDEDGRGRIMRAEGYHAVRISTTSIEEYISANSSDLSASYVWTYQKDGHDFALFQIDGLDTTLVYDAKTRAWHERQHHIDADNTDKQHLGSCHCFFNGFNLVGDRLTGKIYKMLDNYYYDDTARIHRERITPGFNVENKFVPFSEIEVDMQTGVGLDVAEGSEGYDPKLMISMSKDGARTFGNERMISFGKQGEYDKRVRSLGWGAARKAVFKLRVTDPVDVFFHGSMYVN